MSMLIECKEITEQKGSYEDLVDVRNNLLQSDSFLGVVSCLFYNPTLTDKDKCIYTLVKCRETLMKMFIVGESTMNVIT